MTSFRSAGYTSEGNQIGDPNGNILPLVIDKLRATAAAAKGVSPLEQAPWIAAPLWVTGTTYYTGQYVRNSAGNLYQLHPACYPSAVAGTIQPVQIDNTGVYDGAGNTGCLWLYRGTSTGTDTTNTLVSYPPTSGADIPSGYLSVYNDGASTWTATGCSIAGTTLTIGVLTSGSISVGTPVSGTGVAAGTQILANISGAGSGSTWTVSKSQTVASEAMQWGGTIGSTANGGYNLTYQWNIGQAAGGKVNPFTITGGPIDLVSQYPYINVAGFNSGTVLSPSYTTAAMSWQVGFETNARWISFRPSAPIYNGGAQGLRFEVDGRMLSMNQLVNTLAPTAGGNAILFDLSKFPSTPSGMHTVRIYGSNILVQQLLYVVYTGPNDVIYPLSSANQLKIAFEGDSLTGGGNGNPVDKYSYWANYVTRMLGQENFFVNAVGGTGFLQNNNNAGTTYIQRLATIQAFAPDVVIIGGNHNDGPPNYTSAQRQAAVTAYLQAVRALGPNILIFVTGTRMLCYDNIANDHLIENDMLAAITAINDPYTFFIPTTTDPNGDITNGTGWWTGGANPGRYYYQTAPYTDAHPLPAEYDMFAHKLTNAIRLILSNLN